MAIGDAGCLPFSSVEEAWFWTMGALRARREGQQRGGAMKIARPCEPDDVIRCLDRLYRNRRIELAHARVLRNWGERQMPPSLCRTGGQECALWREAMACLDPALRQKGIVH
jgi:hypothetical protein